MLKQLKYILNSYSDDQLKEMSLWINSSDIIKYILVEDEDIILITEDAKLKINDYEEN